MHIISLGVTLDNINPDYYLTVIRLFTRHENKEIDLIPLRDIRTLEEILKFRQKRNYDRVIFYDLDELGGMNDFEELAGICKQHNMEFSFLKQDSHSFEK